ncbi:MAG: hypothetical protein ACTSRG_23505 [Candidatus Helarchaeota archaeon]
MKSRILLDKLIIENFGPYIGQQTIEFSKPTADAPEKNLTLIKGLNVGTGKSILFKFFIWLIFGLEKKDWDILLDLINRKLKKEKDKIKVGGSLQFDLYDNSNNLIGNFELKRYFNFRDNKIISEEFEISKGGQILPEDEQIKIQVKFNKEIFHPGVKSFLFVRGEKLDDLFESNEEEQLKKVKEFAILLSDSPKLETYEILIRQFATLVQKKLSAEQRGEEKLNNLNNLLEKKENELNKIRGQIQENNEIIEKLSEENDKLLKLSTEYAENAAEVEKLRNCKNEIEELKGQINNSAKKRSKILMNYAPWLYLEKAMKICLEDLKNKEGILWPKNIDRKTALALVKNKEYCEACGTEWTEKSRKWIEDIIKKLPEGFDNNLVINFRDNIEQQLNDLETIKADLKEIETDLLAKNGKLINKKAEYDKLDKNIDKKYKEANWLDNFRKIQKQREKKIKEKTRLEEKNKYLTKKIHGDEERRGLNEEIKNLKANIKKVETEIKKEYYWAPVRDKLEKIEKLLYKMKAIFTKKLKSQIEINTTKIFKELIWDPENFGDIIINEEKGGWKVQFKTMPVISTGQTYILGLSYILSLGETIDIKFPLIIDSPFVVLDYSTRELLVEKLPNIMRDSQLIMFVKDQELERIEKKLEKYADKEYILKRIDGNESQILEVDIFE